MLKRRATLFVGRTRTQMPEALQRFDDAGYDALARRHSPVLDATLPRLTRAANHGRLWYAVAAVLLLSKHPQARRAASRALRALAVTSTIVNGPLKLLVRRGRPLTESVPLARRLTRAPATSSFPSGHAASAAAFAVAASLEMPTLAPPLATLAAAVGASRVYVGAHYPSDVLVGAAVGAGIAIATRKAPRHGVDMFDRHPPAIEGTVDVAQGKGLLFLVNPASGSPLPPDPRRALEDAFPDATFTELERADTDVPAAGTDDLAVLGVCGGDGTVNAAASLAIDRGVPLLVVPGGTLNHFARDIGIERVADAVDAARSGDVACVDVASIDGRRFLNTASFGAYAEMVDERERLEGRIGKWPAAIVALARVLRRSAPVEVHIDGRRRRLWAIFIGNGQYQPRGLAPSARASLEDGLLDVRILRAEGRWSRLRLLAAALTRDLGRSGRYEEWTSDRLEVRSADGPLRLACDGETFDGPTAFTIEKHPRELAVIVPRPEEPAPAHASESLA